MDKQFLKNFKSTVEEAGKNFNRKPHQVTMSQFWLSNKGRCPHVLVRSIGFASLREYCFPTPQKQLDKSTKSLIKKILGE